MANDSRNPSAVRRRSWPLNFSNSISRHAGKMHEAQPYEGRRPRSPGVDVDEAEHGRADDDGATIQTTTQKADGRAVRIRGSPFRFARTSLCLRVTCRTTGRACAAVVGGRACAGEAPDLADSWRAPALKPRARRGIADIDRAQSLITTAPGMVSFMHGLSPGPRQSSSASG
jgi:hypothetical protein